MRVLKKEIQMFSHCQTIHQPFLIVFLSKHVMIFILYWVGGFLNKTPFNLFFADLVLPFYRSANIAM